MIVLMVLQANIVKRILMIVKLIYVEMVHVLMKLPITRANAARGLKEDIVRLISITVNLILAI